MNKRIDVLLEYSTNGENGGVINFLKFLYSQLSKNGYIIREFFMHGDNHSDGTVEYIKLNNLTDFLEYDEGNLIFSNLFYYMKGWKYNELKKISKKCFNRMIFQQHTNPEKYKMIKIRKYHKYLSTYSASDMKKFHGGLGWGEFIMGSDNRSQPWHGGKGILFSGRGEKENISPLLKLKRYKDITISTPINYDFINECRNEFRDVQIGEKPNYSDFDAIIQLENKGYGISVLEAMSHGVPAIILGDFPSYKHIAPVNELRGKNMNDINNILNNHKWSKEKSEWLREYYDKNVYGWSKRFIERIEDVMRREIW